MLATCSSSCLQFFVGDVDIFGGGDAVDDQFGFHVVVGALALTVAQATQSTLTARGSMPCCAERANDALEADIHLMLDEHFGHGELVELDQCGQNFFAQHVFFLVIALVL